MSDPLALSSAIVVGSVLEDGPDATVRRIRDLHPGCAIVEIRADRLTPAQVAEVLGRVERPVMVTVRRREDGGEFDGSETERRSLLETALTSGARLVDVEWNSAAADLADRDRADRVVLSHHGAPCRVDELSRLHREMASSFPGRIKIVPQANEVREIGAVRTLLLEAQDRIRGLACFAMGRAGVASRLLAPSWGSWATYGAASPDRLTAEGQLTAGDLIDLWDVLRIDAKTRRHALVGTRVSTSPSPAMHHAAYGEGGVNACYLPIEIDRIDEVDTLVGREGSLGIETLAVTLPFKQEAARRSRAGDEVAEAAGAVNTVTIDASGSWNGFNTDGPAAVELLRRHLDLSGARVAILGAGGTACGIGTAVRDAGATITLFNRTLDRAREAAGRLGVAFAPIDALPSAGWDALVQTTPLGGAGESVLPDDRLRGSVVLDVVYGSRPTPLIRSARRRGLGGVDGFDLLVAQAVLQYRRMTGADASAETMARAGRRWLAARGA